MDSVKMFFTEHNKLVGIVSIIIGAICLGVAIMRLIVSGFAIAVLVGLITGIVILLFGILVAVRGIN